MDTTSILTEGGYGPEQFVPFIATVAGVVLTDLLIGVGMGMAISIIFLLQRNYRNSHFLHKEEIATEKAKHIVTLRLAEEVTFLNKAAIKRELSAAPKNCRVIIDKRNCIYINHDIAEIIAEFIDLAPSRGITVELIDREPGGPPWREFKNNTVAA